jgi:hypothetical protein
LVISFGHILVFIQLNWHDIRNGFRKEDESNIIFGSIQGSPGVLKVRVVHNITITLISVVDVNTLDVGVIEPVVAIELNPCGRMPKWADIHDKREER